MRPFAIDLRPPGSKSLTNRALLLSALAEGTSTLAHPLLDADDAERMMQAIEQLGARIERSAPDQLRITGVNGRWQVRQSEAVLNLNNAGTATRFLTAASLLSPVPITIDGNARMRQRPIAELIEALRQLGARPEYLGNEGVPPVRIHPPSSLARDGRIYASAARSSQYISALLLVAPFLPGSLTVMLHAEPASRSYIEMTLGMLKNLGVSIDATPDLRSITVASARAVGGMSAFNYTVEPDASSATYFWAAAALIPDATCRIDAIGARSLQPDALFPKLLAQMGALVEQDEHSTTVRGPARLRGISADLSLMPDAAMTLAAVACFADGCSVLRGLHTLRHKESDRLAALQTELSKIGARVEIEGAPLADTLRITPPSMETSPTAPRVDFETYDDHRMAMSLSLIGLRRPNTFIADPTCVAKTYPTFWADLARLYA